MKGLVEMNTTKERVADATSHVRPYVERALRDEELRRNVKDAYTSARALYEQLLTRNDVSHVATKLVSDEDVQAQLRNVVAQLRGAAGRVQTAQEETQKAERSARGSLLLVAGVADRPARQPAHRPVAPRLAQAEDVRRRGDGFVYHDGNGTPLKLAHGPPGGLPATEVLARERAEPVAGARCGAVGQFRYHQHAGPIGRSL